MVTKKNNQVSAIQKEKETLQKHYAAHWALLLYLETGEQVAGQHPGCNILSREHQPQNPPSEIYISCFSVAVPHVTLNICEKHLQNAGKLITNNWNPSCTGVKGQQSAWALQNLLIFCTLHSGHQSCCSSLVLWPGHGAAWSRDPHLLRHRTVAVLHPTRSSALPGTTCTQQEP